MRGFLLAVVVTFSVPVGPAVAGPLLAKLQTPVHSYEVSAPTFVDALVAAASRFRVPMGIEVVRSSSVMRPVELSWREATGMQVFTAIIGSQRGYALRVNARVLHVFPKDLVNSPSNFLNIRVPKFDLRGVIATEAGRELWQITNQRMRPKVRPTPGPHGTAGSMLSEVGNRTFSLALCDTTARGVLDAIAKASEYKVWLVTFSPGGALMRTDFRRTAAFRSGRVGLDTGQPTLEQLKWGESPY